MLVHVRLAYPYIQPRLVSYHDTSVIVVRLILPKTAYNFTETEASLSKHSIVFQFAISSFLLSFVLANVLSLATSRAAGATYYIDPNGVDDSSRSGSAAAPWRSLAFAASRVPGDPANPVTIHINPGVYTETAAAIIKPGVNVEGGSGDASKTVLLSTINTALIKLENHPVVEGNQTLRNFTIEGFNQLDIGVFIVGRHNVKVYNLTIDDTQNIGLVHSGWYANNATSARITGGEIAYTTIIDSGTEYDPPGQTASGNYGGNLQPGGWIGGSVHHNTVIDVEAGAEGGYGIKTYNGGYMTGTKFHDNTIEVSETAHVWGGMFSIEIYGCSDHCEVYNNKVNTGFSFVGPSSKGQGTRSIVVHDNRIVSPNPVATEAIEADLNDAEYYNNYTENFNLGFYISGGPTRNVLVHHNVFRGPNRMQSIGYYVQNAASSNNYVYNNVFDRFARGVALHKESNNLVFKNNIFMNIAPANTYNPSILEADSSVQGIVFDHNILFNYGNTLRIGGTGGGISWTNNLDKVNPQLTSSGAKPAPFYQPAKTSPAIDAGVQVNNLDGKPMSYGGKAPDIGAYECGSQGTSVTGISSSDSGASSISATTSNRVYLPLISTAGPRC